MKDDELFSQLRERFERDQKLIKRKNGNKYDMVRKSNSEWLKQIINEYGWSTKERVGKKGEKYAWIIIQHSDDLEFQRKCLKLLKKLPKTDERKKYIAYLTDRIRVNEGKKQIYGTQFSKGKFLPIKDRDNLDERRDEMNLDPFNKYKERIGKNK